MHSWLRIECNEKFNDKIQVCQLEKLIADKVSGLTMNENVFKQQLERDFVPLGSKVHEYCLSDSPEENNCIYEIYQVLR